MSLKNIANEHAKLKKALNILFKDYKLHGCMIENCFVDNFI